MRNNEVVIKNGGGRHWSRNDSRNRVYCSEAHGAYQLGLGVGAFTFLDSCCYTPWNSHHCSDFRIHRSSSAIGGGSK